MLFDSMSKKEAIFWHWPLSGTTETLFQYENSRTQDWQVLVCWNNSFRGFVFRVKWVVSIVLDVAFGASQDEYHFSFVQDKGHDLNIQNSKWVPLIDHNNSYPQDKDHFSYPRRGHHLIVKHSK